jgi:hypothetical protein
LIEGVRNGLEKVLKVLFPGGKEWRKYSIRTLSISFADRSADLPGWDSPSGGCGRHPLCPYYKKDSKSGRLVPRRILGKLKKMGIFAA